MRIETIAVHAGQSVDQATGAVMPPIHLSSTFERDPDGSYPRGYMYARNGNPNRDSLEQTLSTLEGGATAAAFASGSAATAAIFQALSPGDHVVAPTDAYHGTTRLLTELFARWGLRASFVDMSDPDQVRQALQPSTRLVWAETPSNPLLTVTDIAAVAEVAKSAGALVACDNTWATPILQRPFDLGADLVVHSTTKYLSGHSDLTGGAVVAAEEGEFFQRVRQVQQSGGAVPSPFDCWLVLRGIRTLAYRVKGHCENAERVAHFLNDHPAVKRVYYPGLKNHPGHDVAGRQMKAFGGMMSVQIKGNQEDAMAVAARVKLFTRATSLGGVESLVEHRASIEGPESRTPKNLLRLSVGLEHSDDLIEDLRQAMERSP